MDNDMDEKEIDIIYGDSIEIEEDGEFKRKGNFTLKKVTLLKDLESGKIKSIPESDLTLQSDSAIMQFAYITEKKKRKKIEIDTGCFNLAKTNSGLVLQETELKTHTLLETIDNTSQIMAESDKFFNRLHIFEEGGLLSDREPKRSILLCSPPGVGKSSTITKVCENFLKEEGTTVIIWDTSSISAGSVNNFFINSTVYNKKVKKMILVMEDIDGGSIDNSYGSARAASSSLLNFLDGIGSPFKGTPTLLIATTNNPETSVEALIDRPGRFDKVIELKTPNADETIELLKFISKKDELNEDEMIAAKIAADESFSIAHIQEIVVRSLIDDISMLEACKQLSKHKARFKKAFLNSAAGIGL